MNILKKYKEIISYIFWGAMTTVCNLVVYYLLLNLLNVNYIISNSVAWIVSVTFAFFANRKYVFEHCESNVFREYYKFLLSRIASGLIEILILWIGKELVGVDKNIIKLFATFIIVILNYIFSKFFVFKSKGDITYDKEN